MKKTLSFIFAIIFALGISFLAPITSNAASTDDLTFELNVDKKSYSVVKCNVSNYNQDGDLASPIDLIIPSEYKGLPVTKISTYAFTGCESVKSVVIPDSVTVIDAQAFEGCSALASITMSKNITKVGMWCFGKTKFYDATKNWTDGVLYCGNVLVEAKENISGACTIKNGTKCIADSAFRFREKLTSVTIPGTVTHIGDQAFYGCALSKVVIPEGVVSVGNAAFGGNQKLTTITFPKSVKSIYDDVLINCESLKTVNYNGTKSEWSKIKIGEYNKHLTSAKLVCTGKEIVLTTPTVKISNTAKGVKVSWGSVANAQSYVVYRQIYNTSTKKWSSWSAIKKGVTGTSYVDGTVKLGTQYRYTVRAVNGSVMSKYTSTGTLKYNVTPAVKIANASNGVKVSWSTATNATGYTVYRSQYNTKTKKWSGWSNRGTAKAKITSWTDKKVTSGVQYKYTVRACNGSFKSSYKESAKVLYLAQPTVKIANASNGIKVSWNKVAGSKGYIVYRSQYTNGAWSSWKNMGTAKNTKTSWVDKNVVSGVTYRYTARVVNGSYKSTYKETSSLIYLAQPTVKIANDSKGIKVSWNQIAGAKGYIVYSSIYDAKTKKWSSWKNLGSVSAVSWVDESAVSGVQYKYTVRAINGNYKSTYKESAILLYLAEPVVTVKATENTVNVNWSKSAGATEYIVYRAELQSGAWSKWSAIFNSDNKTFLFVDDGIEKSVEYKYTVRAINGSFKSTYKASESVELALQGDYDESLVKTSDTLFMNYPPLTDEYILPLDKNITYSRNESQIYENEYVKVDATTGKDGYILITYKDPWASKLWITLDETSVETGLFNKSYQYYFNSQEFTGNKPIAIRLPVSDALYYMCVASTIKGKETIKMEVDLGQITAEGTIPLQEIIPTEEEIILTNNNGVYSNKFVRIDTTTASEGYIILENLDERAYNIGVYISADVINDLEKKPNFIWISDSKGKSSIKVPLTYGVTSYNITVVTSMTYDPTGSECSSKKAELTFTPTSVSETGGFLLSAGEVIYDENMMFIKKAKEIAATCSNDFEKVEKIQAWVTSYMSYKDEEATPMIVYQCDLEKIYNRKTGVCYDYAVILAAMLRSQGIPCKLDFGYYDGVGHVWTEVYVDSEGVLDADNVYLEGKKWCRVEATLSGANGVKEFINESDKYVWGQIF